MSHEDATKYMNFSSIQTNSRDIVILWLILWQINVITLFIFIYIYIYYLDIKINIYIYIIDNFINFNLYHVETCHYLN